MTEINTSFESLINKEFVVPELNIPRFDNSEDYVQVKKTRKGEELVIKPEVLSEIKKRLELDGA